MSSTPLLQVHQVSKRFGSVQALSSVSLTLQRGRVYGLAGENGAGKSTLVKILCGVLPDYEGQIHLEGKDHRPRTAAQAERSGISVFHQEIPTCPSLSVAANVFLGPDLPDKRFFPNWRRLEARCEALFRDLLGIEIDARRLMGKCTVAERQLALLVRALSRDARLVILDEPTTALTPPEVARLFGVIRRLLSQGVTFLFVSHLLDELLELCDEIYVLRDGVLAGQRQRGEFDARSLAQMIAGHEVADPQPATGTREGMPRLEVRGLSLPGAFRDISFQICAGEILGITGLQGCGRSAVARALFGTPPAEAGEIFVNGERILIRTIADAIRNGIGYVPEERQTLGLFDDLDVQSNLGILRLDSSACLGLLPGKRLRELALQMQSKLQIKFSSPEAPIQSLSGGNQQKVLIGRWLAAGPEVLVMNEPTRGVDIGAKDEICRFIRKLATEGCSFVVSSSDLDELMRLADRVLVMNQGRITAEFSRAALRKEDLISTPPAQPSNPLGDFMDAALKNTPTPPARASRTAWLANSKWRDLGVLAAALAVGISFAALTRSFLTPYNLFNLLRQTSELGIVAMAMTVLIVSGEFDLSVGAIYAVTGVVTALAFKSIGIPIWAAAGCGMGSALLLGLINGLLVTRARMSSFIATLATMMVFRGIAMVLSQGQPMSGFPHLGFFEILGRAKLFGSLPVPVLWLALAGVLLYTLLHRTAYGIKVFATGDNCQAANLAGIRTGRLKRINFLITAAAAGGASLISLGYLKTVTPTQGTGMELEAIAAAVIGGTAMRGGVGSILGTFLGAFIMAEVRTGLVLIGTGAYVQDACVGLIIALAVILNLRLTKASNG